MKKALLWIGGSVIGLIVLVALFGGSNPSTSTVTPQNTKAPTQTPAAKVTPAPQVTPTPAPQPAPKPTCGSGYYINSDGNCVESPIQAPSVPAGATAICRDGSYSFSQHRSGTCSSHGGVETWL